MPEHDAPRTLIFHPSTRSIVYFGAFRFDLSDGQLTRDGQEVRLPPRALTILQQLVERAGRVVSKQVLMDVAWKDAHVSETSLTEAVGLIRQALGDEPHNPQFIQTVHRRGYRFIAPITTDAPPSRPAVGDDAPSADDVARTAGSVEPPRAPSTYRRSASVAAVAALALFVGIAGLWAWLADRPVPPPDVIRVNIAFPSQQAPVPSLNSHPMVALSPDGQRFVYVGGAPGDTRLFLREMNRFDAMPLAGTEGAHGPFFSPDGEWVAFFAEGRLKKVRLTSSEHAAPQVICASETGVGGAWVSASEIVFVPNWRGPVMRVDASGGQPVAVTPAGPTYRWPDRLDDRTILATRWRSSVDDAAVVAISLASGAERVIAERASFGRYTHDGYVLFLRDGGLFATRVDKSVQGSQAGAVSVVPAVMTGTTGAAQFTVSSQGSLLYADDIPERSLRTLARVDGRGAGADLPIAPRQFQYVNVCGGRLAATVLARGQPQLWAGHIDRAAMTQITREGAAAEPVWSPDCRTIAFSWNRDGVANIYTVAIDSGEAPRVLFESRFSSAPGSWSADGRWLAYTEQRPETSSDIWLWDRVTGQSRPLIATAAIELLPALSPDGTSVAYETNAAGLFEVEVASVRTGARSQVSVGGGTWPAWSADGRQLFFLHDTSIVRAAVEWNGGQLVASDPVSLFTHPEIVLFKRASDGFVYLRRTAGAVPLTRMNLVLNWSSELKPGIR